MKHNAGSSLPPAAIMTRSLLSLFCLLMMTGCGSVSYQPKKSAAPNEAEVWVIRQRTEPLAWKLRVHLDGARVALLANRSLVKLRVPAGSRTIMLDWPSLAGKVKYQKTLSLKGGERRFFITSGDIEGLGRYKDEYGRIWVRHSESLGMREISLLEARQVLREMGRKDIDGSAR